MKPYRFDEVARAERYFVTSLLTHLLLLDNFAGLQRLLQHVFGETACAAQSADFELVSELDPLRDGSLFNEDVKKLYREFKRVAVPDLFLRWDKLCLVVEAKFFTDPSAEELGEQIRLQQVAIEQVKPYTLYRDYAIKFCALTVNPTTKLAPEIIPLTWEQVIQMVVAAENPPPDVAYCLRILQEAQRRVSKARQVSYEKLSYHQLLNDLSRLVAQGKIFIGYTGGEEALATATLESLVNRAHYKVSEFRWSDNWITLDQFLHRVFQVRGLGAKPVEEE